VFDLVDFRAFASIAVTRAPVHRVLTAWSATEGGVVIARAGCTVAKFRFVDGTHLSRIHVHDLGHGTNDAHGLALVYLRPGVTATAEGAQSEKASSLARVGGESLVLAADGRGVRLLTLATLGAESAGTGADSTQEIYSRLCFDVCAVPPSAEKHLPCDAPHAFFLTCGNDGGELGCAVRLHRVTRRHRGEPLETETVRRFADSAGPIAPPVSSKFVLASSGR
jgi:hypothetical protein